MVRCGCAPTKARIRRRSCQELTLHQALFASASASAPRLPSDFIACSMAATASVKNSSSSAGSRSRNRVTTMTGMTISFLWVGRSAGGTGGEGFLDGRGYFLGDAELVDHARDDQAAAVHVERGGVAV